MVRLVEFNTASVPYFSFLQSLEAVEKFVVGWDGMSWLVFQVTNLNLSCFELKLRLGFDNLKP